MEFEDKTLICADCSGEFIHSGADQARYAERGFTNEPKRCRPCREKRRAQTGEEGAAQGGGEGGGGGHSAGGPRRPRSGGGGDRPPRDRTGPAGPGFEAVCAACGAKTTVPFQPTQGRPVYCRDCFRSKRRPSGPPRGAGGGGRRFGE
jgi:CxxC-x17-CxxC domain-containing protein